MKALPKKLGIVAGGGLLPAKLLAFCDANGIETFVVGFDGHVDPELLQGRDHMLTRIGAAGSILKTLQERECDDLVLIGSVKRPKLSELRPDLRTAAFFAKLGLRAIGDDGLLKALRAELEKEGFRIHGIHEILDGLLMTKGVLGKCHPTEDQYEDIRIGLAGSRKLGAEDIGQCVVALNEEIIGTEDAEGTNSLIRRAAQPGAILVKSSKPQQDRKLDMPTIGSDTVRLCASLGYAGIAAEYDGVLLADRDVMVTLADELGLFIVGV
ncbi:MAG: DUF1009 domain-containing protein [Micavibrio aeruginosavorus]|uniref:DUF1009 domain-containing protein n=1 Tax=Micavibrio aeruginosavorus TaxID=349221 RepID=A0A2W5BMV8_9BACT|nr:MAG: DUF1009 domain-containing protein [Micavibrio aeruginosavorus]